jgi:glutamate synthase (NADPH/NADH) large chain
VRKNQDIMSTQIEERDACAIIAFVDKRGQSTHANIVQTIDALRKMGHRSGDINGDGDGCGITTDIPRDIWSRRLARDELRPHLAESNSFFVGHFLIPASVTSQSQEKILSRTRRLFSQNGAFILVEMIGNTRDEELGPRARIAAPLFWQIGGLITDNNTNALRENLFSLQLELERELPEMHIASLSLDSVVFKVQGVPDMLPRVYPELRDQDMSSVMTLGHGRYSTNTLPTVERSQPFSLLGHNGEINTIDKLRSIGETLGIEPIPGGSDSQDLNRVIEGLINFYELDILEAMEMVFPAIYSEVKNYNEELQEVYSFYRWFFPCSAQGPAAILARSGDVCIGSVDALGLRPLWFGESDYNYFFSSEKGVVALERNMNDPRPLAPGEKIVICGSRGKPAEILNYGDIQKRLVELFRNRPRTKKYLRALHLGISASESTGKKKEGPASNFFLEKMHTMARFNNPNSLGAFGWRQ